jgi:dinuclear metal center YbgI/SA1388 family protein
VTTVADRLSLLEGWFPPDRAEPWDNPGLQVGDPQAPADRVLCALDPTIEVVREAADTGAGLVVTHHPLIFDPLVSLDASDPVGATLLEAARLGVAVIACHTNADVADPGVSDALAAALGLSPNGALVPGPAGAPGLGRVCESEAVRTAVDWLERCRDVLGANPVLIGDGATRVARIGVCGGSGASTIPAARAAGADLLITGDVKHHAALDALASGLAVIDAGHHATEWPWVPAVAARLTEAGVDAIVSQVNTDPFEGTR